MSYPQPDANKYALNGFKFFRLNTPLTSDGDIYESAQGAQGFAIGPDSDISKVNIGYYDEQVPRFLNQIAITPERAFPGLIPARNEVNYVPSNEPGRILIWSDELYNPTWDPNFVDVSARIDFEVPVMDVIQYFAPAAQAMNQGRNDREYWYDFIAAPAAQVGFTNAWVLVIPYYGRRFCDLTWQSQQPNDVQVSISGLHYKPGTANTAAIATPLIDDGAAHGGAKFVTVPAGESYHQVVLASMKTNGGAVSTAADDAVATFQVNAGMYDALAIQFTSVGTGVGAIDRSLQSTLRLRTSDRENG